MTKHAAKTAAKTTATRTVATPPLIHSASPMEVLPQATVTIERGTFPDAAQTARNDMQTLPLVNVSIERGRDTVVVGVPEHEVAILKLVHGEHNVRVNDDADEDDGDFTTDADTEFLRLQAKYRRVNAADPVLIAYPLGAKSLDGFTLGRGRRQAPAQSVAINYRKADRATAKAK